MLENLVDSKNLKKVTPPRMQIGDFWTFESNNNLMGIGQQAIHNSGSTMMRDTPNFKKQVLNFLHTHINYNSEEFVSYSQFDIKDFFYNQQSYLNEFKNNLKFRKECLDKIFISPFVFSKNIETKFLFISLMLYFIKKYNYFTAKQQSHLNTKVEIKKYFKNETAFLKSIYELLISLPKINYILDVCYGRYYFLEVHFLEKTAIRNTPLEIINEFFETGLEKVDDTLFDKDFLGLVEQEKISRSNGYGNVADIEKVNNRTPELNKQGPTRKFKTNIRLAKTVLKNKEFNCEVDKNHETFLTKRKEKYAEAHHLIPMSEQNNFLPINLDREQNIFSLCPTCHRAIHYGVEKEKVIRLKILYEQRIKELNKAGISINFNDLIILYR